MSRSMHLVCLDCKESIWIGQNDDFYFGEHHTMKALNEFLVKHRSFSTRHSPTYSGVRYHELIYTPEPYNGGIEEEHGVGELKEWDTDKWKEKS